MTGDDIGIIAPYVGQVGTIRRTLYDRKRLSQFANLLGQGREDFPLDVEVSTVDAFEGREKKIIIFSTTRSNSLNRIGFMDDWRRLNVAMTRAQRVSRTIMCVMRFRD